MTTYPFVSTKRLGVGGMGEVYLAVQRGGSGFERVCVVKRLQPKHHQNLDRISRFKEEARLGQSLRHDNICEVLDFAMFGGEPAIVMEHVLSVDLSALIELCRDSGRTLTPAAAIFIAAEVARGLHFAHTLGNPVTGERFGIVHRDVSPSNILVGFEGEVKLTDFGIAFADKREKETAAGIVVGKLGYLSPEQAMDLPLDGRSDVFSLALVLIEALTLEKVYADGKQEEVLAAVREANLEPHFVKIALGFDDELAAILARALDPTASERYADAAELERALRGYLGDKFPGFTREALKTFLHDVGGARLKAAREGIQEALRRAAHVTAEKARSSYLGRVRPGQSFIVHGQVKVPLTRAGATRAWAAKGTRGVTRGSVVGRVGKKLTKWATGAVVTAMLVLVAVAFGLKLANAKGDARIAKPARKMLVQIDRARGAGIRRAAAVAQNGKRDLKRLRHAVRHELLARERD